ncbi:unnamed protein product [Amoebophrya sp. A120]|nr:unnamed protein product [Amoebophrya sp. A120]|eukprot:GSA120T00006392001.1
MAEETNEAILEARRKLQAKFDSRIGGKGTQRRKVKAKPSTASTVNDDKKLVTQFKKMGLNQIPGIEEVNMFTDKNEVIHFKDPKVHASLQANTYAVAGNPETKSLQEMLPKVINQLGSENLMSLRSALEASGTMPGAGAKPDEIPDLGDATFEDAAKVEDVEVD